MNGGEGFPMKKTRGNDPVSLDSLMAPDSACSPHSCAPPPGPDSDAPC